MPCVTSHGIDHLLHFASNEIAKIKQHAIEVRAHGFNCIYLTAQSRPFDLEDEELMEIHYALHNSSEEEVTIRNKVYPITLNNGMVFFMCLGFPHS